MNAIRRMKNARAMSHSNSITDSLVSNNTNPMVVAGCSVLVLVRIIEVCVSEDVYCLRNVFFRGLKCFN